jgi:hypothetical protein
MNTEHPVALTDIEQLTRKYADAREELSDLLRAMNEKLEQVKRATLPRILELVNRTAEREANLRAALKGAPDLFTRPRTCIFHGVKVGYQKGKGVLDIPDVDRTVEKIKTLLENPANFLRIVETPDKQALAQLPLADLRKLGCTLTETGDQVVIKPVDGEVDKIVNALLREAAAAELETASKN